MCDREIERDRETVGEKECDRELNKDMKRDMVYRRERELLSSVHGYVRVFEGTFVSLSHSFLYSCFLQKRDTLTLSTLTGESTLVNT